MIPQTRTTTTGHWIVRGILPVISRLYLRHDGSELSGTMDMWGTTVALTGRESGEGAQLHPDARAGFDFTVSAAMDGDVMRLSFTNVGVDFALVADRVDAAQSASHRAAEFRPLPTPPVRDLAPDGLATRPPMGWNSWFAVRLQVDDASIRRVADDLVRTGLRDVGFTDVTIDDGWQAARDARGDIVPSRAFPDMSALGEYLHERDLHFGIYSSPGPATCADYPGSFGHEEQDARTYASWGVDYLKYDWCSASALYGSEAEMRGAYQRMGEALRASGRPIVLSLCQYGLFDVARWGSRVGAHLWRTHYDVEDRWESIAAIGFGDHADRGGGWNDLDMLQIGLGGMSLTEYRTQMTLWSMLSAPLILSCDVSRLSRDEMAVLTNPHVIAIDQDALGAPPQRHRQPGGAEVWTKELSRGTAVGIFNPTNEVVECAVDWSDVIVDEGAEIHDLWNDHRFSAASPWRGQLDPHDCVLLSVDRAR